MRKKVIAAAFALICILLVTLPGTNGNLSAPEGEQGNQSITANRSTKLN